MDLKAVPLLKWLHLSDAHLPSASNDSYRADKALDALMNTLKNNVSILDVPDLIFFTGDLADNGRNYTKASEFFDDLLDNAGLVRALGKHEAKRRLFVMPGNHDADREKTAFIQRPLSSTDDADEFFAPKCDHRRTFYNRFHAFSGFFNRYFKDIRHLSAQEHFVTENVRLKKGSQTTSIGVVGLNTAWFSQDDTDEGKLWVGERTCDLALRRIKQSGNCDLTIVFQHHPLNWLHWQDRASVRRLLSMHNAVLLFGHDHQADTRLITDQDGEQLLLCTGALYEKATKPKRALWATVYGAPGALRVLIHPMRFDGGSCWTTDPELYPHERRNGYCKSFKLPQQNVAIREGRLASDLDVAPPHADRSSSLEDTTKKGIAGPSSADIACDVVSVSGENEEPEDVARKGFVHATSGTTPGGTGGPTSQSRTAVGALAPPGNLSTIPTTMRALVLYGKEDARVEHIPVPAPGPGELLIKVGAALTCGTDLKVFRRGYHAAMIRPPSVFGHEMAGTVAACGPAAGAPPFPPGTRVVVANSAPCGACPPCRRGQENLCEDLRFLNGAYAEYMLVPERFVANNTYRIADSLAFEAAALAEPLACVVHALDDTPVRPGDTVAILGLGPIGLMFIALLKKWGARAVGLGRQECRIEAAKALGAEAVFEADSAGRWKVELLRHYPHLDVVVEATGRPETWEVAVDLVRRGGCVNLFGGCPSGTAITLNTHRLHYDQITVKSSFHHRPPSYRAAVAALEIGTVPHEPFIGGKGTLESLPDLFRQMLSTNRSIKTCIYPHSEV
jgi:L-iditol 2-dehydrogenase